MNQYPQHNPEIPALNNITTTRDLSRYLDEHLPIAGATNLTENAFGRGSEPEDTLASVESGRTRIVTIEDAFQYLNNIHARYRAQTEGTPEQVQIVQDMAVALVYRLAASETDEQRQQELHHIERLIAESGANDLDLIVLEGRYTLLTKEERLVEQVPLLISLAQEVELRIGHITDVIDCATLVPQTIEELTGITGIIPDTPFLEVILLSLAGKNSDFVARYLKQRHSSGKSSYLNELQRIKQEPLIVRADAKKAIQELKKKYQNWPAGKPHYPYEEFAKRRQIVSISGETSKPIDWLDAMKIIAKYFGPEDHDSFYHQLRSLSHDGKISDYDEALYLRMNSAILAISTSTDRGFQSIPDQMNAMERELALNVHLRDIERRGIMQFQSGLRAVAAALFKTPLYRDIMQREGWPYGHINWEYNEILREIYNRYRYAVVTKVHRADITNIIS